jgi:muconolactone delta-isomerase
MVTFTLPKSLNEDFIKKVPDQRHIIDRYIVEGSIQSYMFSLEAGAMWLVCNSPDENHLLRMLASLPLSRFMKAKFSTLNMFQSRFPFDKSFSLS